MEGEIGVDGWDEKTAGKTLKKGRMKKGKSQINKTNIHCQPQFRCERTEYLTSPPSSCTPTFLPDHQAGYRVPNSTIPSRRYPFGHRLGRRGQRYIPSFFRRSWKIEVRRKIEVNKLIFTNIYKQWMPSGNSKALYI